ncbi:MAG: hypothetical protein OXJ62_00400 [Spirochaetaceae bacterium]|nr:hypothetical protein [Spirochaetaceae bacterium]
MPLDWPRARFEWNVRDDAIVADEHVPFVPPDPANLRRVSNDGSMRELPVSADADTRWLDSSGSEITVSLFLPLAIVHAGWCKSPQLFHPLAPLVDAWQRRPPDLSAATVTATASGAPGEGMIRRAALVSTLRRTAWRPDEGGPDPLVTGAVVDGEPMAAPRPDTVDLFPVRKCRPRRRFKPGEQCTLPLPVVPTIHHDLRLIALADLSGDPVLQGDVLALMAFAWAADRPLHVTVRAGAALLARSRDGKPRAQIKPTDETRFWEASAALRALVARDPAGTGAWTDLATVEIPRVRPVDRVTIGPPAWARVGSLGKWTLTAEASAASVARAVSGKQGMAGRIITGIEYRLAAGWTGRSGTVAPDLRPADRRRKASPGPVVELDWRTVLMLAGDWWDRANPQADRAAWDRYSRAVQTLRRRGYFVPDTPRAEAPAGDSVEIVDRVRAARWRPAGLLVRASARFVQAARLAQQPQGRGFETRKLVDWVGL